MPVSPQVATSQPDNPAGLEEAVKPVLETASRCTELPVLAFSRDGKRIGQGEDPGAACELGRSHGDLESTHDGTWTCAFPSCPHHGSFKVREIQVGGSAMLLAHCEESDKIALIGELAKVSIRAHFDSVSLLDELGRMYEEVNWLYGLGDIVQREIEQSNALVEVFRHAADLLPISDAEIWVSDLESRAYRCLIRCEDSGVVGKLETLEKTPQSEEFLQQMSPRVIRSESGEADAGHEILLAMTRSVGLPAVALPLEVKSRFLGTLLFRLNDGECALNASQVKLLTAIARQTAFCIQIHTLVKERLVNESLKREVEIAREIQRRLFPQTVPQHDHYDLYGGCITAARVGGDYYDWFQRDETLGLLVADVSGHNVASGLISMSFRSSFRHFLAAESPIDDILSRVNRALHDELHLSGHFLSAFYCTYSTRSGRLRYVNAGQNRPIVLNEKSQFTDLKESGLLIGILGEVKYPVGEIELCPGDILVLYTDGIVESKNQYGEYFGVQRLQDAVLKYKDKSARQLYHFLLKEMYLFQDELYNRDDVTLVVLKIR